MNEESFKGFLMTLGVTLTTEEKARKPILVKYGNDLGIFRWDKNMECVVETLRIIDFPFKEDTEDRMWFYQ